MRKSLSQSSPGCSPQRALANCKMAGYPDDYIGEAPFGSTFGNFPYYIPFPPGATNGWSTEQVALFGCLGAVRRLTSLLDSVRPHAPRPACEQATTSSTATHKGTKYSRKANFTCLLE